MNRHYEHTYGARKTWNKGVECYCVHVDGRSTYLYYKKYDFAVKKALEFAKNCYKGGWKDTQGYTVTHSFIHVDCL